MRLRLTTLHSNTGTSDWCSSLRFLESDPRDRPLIVFEEGTHRQISRLQESPHARNHCLQNTQYARFKSLSWLQKHYHYNFTNNLRLWCSFEQLMRSVFLVTHQECYMQSLYSALTAGTFRLLQLTVTNRIKEKRGRKTPPGGHNHLKVTFGHLNCVMLYLKARMNTCFVSL